MLYKEDSSRTCIFFWDNGASVLDDIREIVNDRFSILMDLKVVWSEEFFIDNLWRLFRSDDQKYGNLTITKNENELSRFFQFMVIEDPKPDVGYFLDLIGQVHQGNKNFNSLNLRLQCHLSGVAGTTCELSMSFDKATFTLCTSLVLGVDLMRLVMKGGADDVKVAAKDLEGAAGWESWSSFFSTIGMTSDFLVLRNFDGLPQYLDDKDVDILCSSYELFCSAANLKVVNTKKPYKGVVKIQGKEIKFDVRFPGDGYYDPLWARKILDNKVYLNGFYVPCQEDLFFSLLYHAKCQKKVVSDKYVYQLETLSRKLMINGYNKDVLSSNSKSARLLSGFLKQGGYCWTCPIDDGVFNNLPVTEFLPKNPGNLRAHCGFKLRNKVTRLAYSLSKKVGIHRMLNA